MSDDYNQGTSVRVNEAARAAYEVLRERLQDDIRLTTLAVIDMAANLAMQQEDRAEALDTITDGIRLFAATFQKQEKLGDE